MTNDFLHTVEPCPSVCIVPFAFSGHRRSDGISHGVSNSFCIVALDSQVEFSANFVFGRPYWTPLAFWGGEGGKKGR